MLLLLLLLLVLLLACLLLCPLSHSQPLFLPLSLIPCELLFLLPQLLFSFFTTVVSVVRPDVVVAVPVLLLVFHLGHLHVLHTHGLLLYDLVFYCA